MEAPPSRLCSLPIYRPRPPASRVLVNGRRARGIHRLHVDTRMLLHEVDAGAGSLDLAAGPRSRHDTSSILRSHWRNVRSAADMVSVARSRRCRHAGVTNSDPNFRMVRSDALRDQQWMDLGRAERAPCRARSHVPVSWGE
jgi:hypothetical protein